MFEAGIKALLGADATLTALVGTRIFPVADVADQHTYPYVTYVSATADSEYAFAGEESRQKTIQFDVWATTTAQGLSVLKAIRDVLSGYSGTLSDGTRVLIAKRSTEMNDFDVNQESRRSVCEYSFELSEV